MLLSVGRSVSSNICQHGVPQSAALDYCLNRLWNEVPPSQRKQELTGSGALRSPDSFGVMRKSPKEETEDWKFWLKKKGVCSSLYKHVEPSWTNALRMAAFYFSEPCSVFPSKKGGGGGGWNMLTQANEREEKYKETNKEREQKSCVELQRMDKSCRSNFPLWSGSHSCSPLTRVAHITNSYESFPLLRQRFSVLSRLNMWCIRWNTGNLCCWNDRLQGCAASPHVHRVRLYFVFLCRRAHTYEHGCMFYARLTKELLPIRLYPTSGPQN